VIALLSCHPLLEGGLPQRLKIGKDRGRVLKTGVLYGKPAEGGTFLLSSGSHLQVDEARVITQSIGLRPNLSVARR